MKAHTYNNAHNINNHYPQQIDCLQAKDSWEVALPKKGSHLLHASHQLPISYSTTYLAAAIMKFKSKPVKVEQHLSLQTLVDSSGSDLDNMSDSVPALHSPMIPQPSEPEFLLSNTSQESSPNRKLLSLSCILHFSTLEFLRNDDSYPQDSLSFGGTHSV